MPTQKSWSHQGWKLDIPVGEKMFKWWDPVYYWYRYPHLLLLTHKIFLYILKVGVPGVQNTDNYFAFSPKKSSQLKAETANRIAFRMFGFSNNIL